MMRTIDLHIRSIWLENFILKARLELLKCVHEFDIYGQIIMLRIGKYCVRCMNE